MTSCPLGHRPLIGFRGQILERNGGNRCRIGIHNGRLPLHRPPQIVVKRYGTGELQGHIEKSVTDSPNFLEKCGPFARSAGLIRQDLEPLHAMLAAQNLDQRIGIGNRGRFVANDHDHVVRRLAEGHDAVMQPRRRIHDQHLDSVIQIAERADDPGVFGRR